MKILAIDFDGTIVEDQFPGIGKMVPGAKEAINELYAMGYEIIIWTSRTHIRMLEAVEWLAKNGIKYHRINESSPANLRMYGNVDSRKIFADMYIDDRGLHPLPPWPEIMETVRDRHPLYADRVAREGCL